MSVGGVYIEREGRQFGLEDRVRLRRQGQLGDQTIHVIKGYAWTFPALRMRLWAWQHGYGLIR